MITGKALRLDSTVCETTIYYPTDAHLPWDCYRVAARIMQQIGKEDYTLIPGHRFPTSKIKQLYTFIATHGTKKKKSTKRKIEKTKDILLQRVAAIVATAQNVVDYGKKNACGIMAMALIALLEKSLADMRHVVAQSRRAFSGETVPARERIEHFRAAY